jgi:hypothetical protein
LPAGAGFRLKPVDEVDDVEKAASGPGVDAGPGERDGEMGLAGTGRDSDTMPRNSLSRSSFVTRSIRELVNALRY